MDSDDTPSPGAPGALDAPARLAALAETRLMDSPAEAGFDRATRLAQRLLGTPVSLVSLVDERRQFFKSAVGLPEPWASRRETPLSHSFCQRVVTTAVPLVVEDATTDERVRGNGAIVDLGVVAYLGVPVRGPAGEPLGSLCAIEHVPRRWTSEELAALTDLAAGVSAEIALRVQATRLEAFARSAAHELRTPVTSLGVRLEDVAGWPVVAEEVRVELVAALDQVHRLADRLDEHLQLARTGRVGVDEEVELDELLRGLVDRRRRLVPDHGGDVHLEPAGPVRAVVPVAVVEQVLDLLVDQALEAGPVVLRTVLSGGVTRLEVRVEGDATGDASDVSEHPRWDEATELARSFGGRVIASAGGRAVQLLLPPRP